MLWSFIVASEKCLTHLLTAIKLCYKLLMLDAVDLAMLWTTPLVL